MIIRSRLRPQPLLRAIVKPGLPSPLRQARSLHNVPVLGSNAETFEANGIPGFLTANVFKMNWLRYQEYLCNYLNQKTQGTNIEGLTAQQLVGKFAHDPENASLFNYASMAVNNHRFFQTLSSRKTEPTGELLRDINSCFDSLENLRFEMLESADAMFGNGFVWLIRENHTGNLRKLCTYNAGSPFPEAHFRQQRFDMSTTPHSQAVAYALTGNSRMFQVQNTVGSFGDHSKNSVNRHPNSLDGSPLLCVNAWEHMWVPDYGVLGKRTYLAAWWERIDWGVVHQNLNAVMTRENESNRMANKPGKGTGSAIQNAMNRDRAFH